MFCLRKDEATAQSRILLLTRVPASTGSAAAWSSTASPSPAEPNTSGLKLLANESLAAVRRIYLAAGSRLVQEQPHHSFGVDLIGRATPWT